MHLAPRLANDTITLLGVAVLCTCSVLGCDTSIGGTLFDVTTTLLSTTCGAAVEVEDSEEFQVRLTLADDTLKWYELDTGDSIEGSVSTDDEFTLAEVEVIQLTQPSDTDEGCSVRRHDSYTGTLTTSGGSIGKAKGEVTSSYTEASGYACDSLIGVSGGFSDLPCEIDYAFVATPAK